MAQTSDPVVITTTLTTTAVGTSTPAPALTTTFVPASSCLAEVYELTYPGSLCYDGTTSHPCIFFHLGADSSTSACMPSGWSDSTSAYFSPGICPSGYMEACIAVISSETTATCCPSYVQPRAASALVPCPLRGARAILQRGA